MGFFTMREVRSRPFAAARTGWYSYTPVRKDGQNCQIFN